MKPNQKFDVCVVGGLGHIGLPLALLFAEAGQQVVVYDINERARAEVAEGRIAFCEDGAEALLRKVLAKNLSLASDPACVAESHFLIVVIGTPVDEHLNPMFTVFMRLFDDLLPHLRDDQHVILCSTLLPGTTARIREYLRGKGKQPRISFCPERIAQGKSLEEHRTLPQIIGAFDEPAAEEARKLFGLFAPDFVMLTPLEAELAKLFTNSWRYIQFAVANQFYQIAAEHDIDFYRVYNAIVHNYPRAKGFSRSGFAAGPCLFKDTMQLAAFSGNNFFLGHAAMLINEGLPNFLVQRLKSRCDLATATVGVLGMAFKADNDDSRESLSYKLKKILEFEAGTVLCADEFIRDPSFVPAAELVRRCDVIVVGTPHSAYRALTIDSRKILVDVWNCFGRGGLF